MGTERKEMTGGKCDGNDCEFKGGWMSLFKLVLEH